MPNKAVLAMLQTFRDTDKTVQEQISSCPNKIACHKGCSTCCENTEVPILIAEIETISWYISERINNVERNLLRLRMAEYRKDKTDCPFLTEKTCFIYPVRPLSCRTFYMTGSPCSHDENIFETRSGDFVKLDSVKMRAAAANLAPLSPFAHLNNNQDFLTGSVLAMKMPIHEFDWVNFVERALRSK